MATILLFVATALHSNVAIIFRWFCDSYFSIIIIILRFLVNQNTAVQPKKAQYSPLAPVQLIIYIIITSYICLITKISFISFYGLDLLKIQGVFFNWCPLKVLCVRLHSKSHQKSSKCQNLPKKLVIFRGAPVKKDTLYLPSPLSPTSHHLLYLPFQKQQRLLSLVLMYLKWFLYY